MHPALGDLAQGAQDGLDGVGLVRVVDDGEVGLSGVHPLQAARHSGDGGDAVGGDLRVDARDGQCDDRGEGVGDVERAGQRGAGGDPLALGADGGEGAVLRSDLDVLGVPVGVRVALGGEAGDRHPGLGDEPAAVLVVEVHDAAVAALGGEEPGLGLEVVLHAGVELHVLRAEVVEDGDVEYAAVDPAEHQGVAGDLHRDGLDAAFAHDGEQGLEVGGFGGGALGLDALVADPHLDGADQPGGPSGGAQSALDEVRGGGLAGGSGDADLEEADAGPPVDVGGQLAHHGARVLGDQDRQAGGGGAFGAGGVGEDGGGAEAGGLGGEVGAVEAGAGQGRVHIAGAHGPRVVRDAGDLTGPGRFDAEPAGQLAERGGPEPVRSGRSRVGHRRVLLRGLGLISVGHGGERTGPVRALAKRGTLVPAVLVPVPGIGGDGCH
ncbi:hypothetical protein SFIMM107S_04285 [Streptomyces griseus]